MTARVRTGARLHAGFLNLSLARNRLYGGIGVAIDRPATVVRVDPADEVDAPNAEVATYARRSVDLLDVPGATVELEEALPRHVGLGSGTQLALAVYVGVATAHGIDPDPREAAPALDRGGRSGVGVATIESGGFVLDAGHPAERFTTARPEPGSWTVPPVVARHDLPEDWRFVVVLPAVEAGLSGDDEDASMRSIVENADREIADEISVTITDRLLPAIASGDREVFGRALAEIDRKNGVWYADEQGGLYRPPVGRIVDDLAASPSVSGAGQSSWGPAVYGVTHADGADAAERAGREALEAAGIDGDVFVVDGRNAGATFETGGEV